MCQMFYMYYLVSARRQGCQTHLTAEKTDIRRDQVTRLPWLGKAGMETQLVSRDLQDKMGPLGSLASRG